MTLIMMTPYSVLLLLLLLAREGSASLHLVLQVAESGRVGVPGHDDHSIDAREELELVGHQHNGLATRPQRARHAVLEHLNGGAWTGVRQTLGWREQCRPSTAASLWAISLVK
jgi:hypothetical protein